MTSLLIPGVEIIGLFEMLSFYLITILSIINLSIVKRKESKRQTVNIHSINAVRTITLKM